MEILFETLGPGVHCYSPFRPSDYRSRDVRLSELCKNVILQCVTLRRLPTALNALPLPRPLLRYISDLSTADFEKIECAPFSDAFSLHFLHRALTYRVVCMRDGLEYMLTYGYSPVETPKLRRDHAEWVRVQHKNLLCICATVRDPSTGNVFYVFDQPRISLEQMRIVFCERRQELPEPFYWRVTADLGEALRCILSKGLQYAPFGLDNVFLVDDRLVLENGLMRKGVKYTGPKTKDHIINEEVVFQSLACILKELLQNWDISESLRDLFHEVERENSLDRFLDLVHKSNQRPSSFSFLHLIRSVTTQ